MNTSKTLILTSMLALGAASACADYDPPPEVEIVAPQGGQWFTDTPLVLRFTEPVDPASVRFAIWPVELDLEGDLRPGVVPVADGCQASSSACGGLTLTMSDDRMTLSVDQGDVFEERLAKPFFFDVAAGLTDTVGRERKVSTRLVFQVDPSSSAGQVDITLNSGVFTIAADLGDVLAGTYLRMIADVSVDPDTGETWLIATVAGKANTAPDGSKVPPNTTDPTLIDPKINGEGWVIALKGQFTPLPEEGAFFLETEPQDIDVTVLGLIRVRLQELRLRATVRPAASPEGRDTFEGVLSSSKVLLGDGDGEDLGAVAAADWTGFGILTEELTGPRYAGLPRICEAAPCDLLVAAGGECQLELPWAAPSPCP
jgi:hypothetical protein